ncbi:MAG: hypothetical protein V1876_04345 [Candidatus Peregrinibacteria bacterium]
MQRIFEVHGIEVSEDCFSDMLQYFSAETRRSFLNGLKRSRGAGSGFKTALDAGILKPVHQSG